MIPISAHHDFIDCLDVSSITHLMENHPPSQMSGTIQGPQKMWTLKRTHIPDLFLITSYYFPSLLNSKVEISSIPIGTATGSWSGEIGSWWRFVLLNKSLPLTVTKQTCGLCIRSFLSIVIHCDVIVCKNKNMQATTIWNEQRCVLYVSSHSIQVQLQQECSQWRVASSRCACFKRRETRWNLVFQCSNQTEQTRQTRVANRLI